MSTQVTGSIALLAALLLTGNSRAEETAEPFCRMVLDEERIELEEAELELDLASSGLEAFEEIFKLIDGLWKQDAIERMVYLQGKYDRDAARLALERAGLGVQKQAALIEQYELACRGRAGGKSAQEEADAIDRSYSLYREFHCAVLTKDVEIAEVNLVFDRELLASVLDLREGKVATRQDVIRAELDVALDEKRLATGKKRAASCPEHPTR